MYQMTLRKISTRWVGCTKVTDDRQMDGWQRIANVNAKIKKKTRAKDVLPNIHHTQAIEIPVTMHSSHPWQWQNGAICCCTSFEAYGTCHSALSVGMTQQFSRFCPWWPFTFDLGIQTRPSEGSSASSLWIWHKSVQRFLSISYTNKQKSHRLTVLKTEPYLRAVKKAHALFATVALGNNCTVLPYVVSVVNVEVDNVCGC